MASKQLNFFITENEYPRINEFFATNEIKVLLEENITDDFRILPLEQLPQKNDFPSMVYLTNNRFLHETKILSTKNGIKYFDIRKSPVLELSLGGFISKEKDILERGRFYYVKSFYNENDELEKKSNSFCEWSDSVIKDFKKEFLQRYSNDKDFLYSKSAIEWIEKNNAEEMGGGLGWKKKV
ncbi:hypothetical protein [Chryseobacterium sp. Marseille-Q8038]